MVDLVDLIAGTLSELILGIFMDRGAIHFILRYLLNRSNYRKRKKGQNFWDWLFYRRYRDVIPREYFIHYMITIFFGLFSAFISFLFLVAFNASDFLILLFPRIYFIHVLVTVINVERWHYKRGQGYDLSEHFDRPGRNKTRKK